MVFTSGALSLAIVVGVARAGRRNGPGLPLSPCLASPPSSCQPPRWIAGENLDKISDQAQVQAQRICSKLNLANVTVPPIIQYGLKAISEQWCEFYDGKVSLKWFESGTGVQSAQCTSKKKSSLHLLFPISPCLASPLCLFSRKLHSLLFRHFFYLSCKIYS